MIRTVFNECCHFIKVFNLLYTCVLLSFYLVLVISVLKKISLVTTRKQ